VPQADLSITTFIALSGLCELLGERVSEQLPSRKQAKSPFMRPKILICSKLRVFRA
jgi:hypothetical protein